jgi:N-acetyl-gamma-glutamyl-phosphate reductase
VTVKVSIIGASGYGGGELARLLAGHPEVELVHLTADSKAGEPMAALYPNLRSIMDRATTTLDVARMARDSDVVFIALPNGRAMELAPSILPHARIVDLGADFRFMNPAVYEQWYKMPHAAAELLEVSAYGLTEYHRAEIRGARIVGNPGCYPTAALLAVVPFLLSGRVHPRGIVIDAKSGVSGAGRGASLGTHFSEVNENVKPYNVAGHRHTPEIEQELSGVAWRPVMVTFTPHLAPLTRGILTTITARMSRPHTTGELLAAYREFYRERPFVRVLEEGRLPETKHVLHSNLCDIGLVADARTGRVVVVSAIDNLAKGASGQAVQCFNLMAGLDERAGLWIPGLFP